MILRSVFKKGLQKEAEKDFTVGTLGTTPDLFSVRAKWPRPRHFLRFVTFSALLFGLLLLGWWQTANTNLIPGLIFIGSFAVPIACVILFFECNVRRNVSLYAVVRAFLYGGVLAIFFSTWLFTFDPTPSGGFWDCGAALIEEPVKLFAVIIVARAAKGRYRLNGLLFGAAVGAGFAAFESAGYALLGFLKPIFNRENMEALLASKGTFDEMMSVSMSCALDVILKRGLMAPFCHVAWTAITAGGLWAVWGEGPFRRALLKRRGFVLYFLIAVFCHAAWNTPEDTLPHYGVQMLSGVVAWVVLLGMARSGIREIRDEQNAVLRKLRGEGERSLIDEARGELDAWMQNLVRLK